MLGDERIINLSPQIYKLQSKSVGDVIVKFSSRPIGLYKSINYGIYAIYYVSLANCDLSFVFTYTVDVDLHKCY